jgi:thiol-disulfide isomerase/thioredoxin
MKLNIFDAVTAVCLVVIIFLAISACGNETTQRPAIVMFTSTYCGPCHAAKAVLDSHKLELEHTGVSVILYDVQMRPDKVRQYSVTVTPTFFVINQAGSVVLRTNDVYASIQKARTLQ